MSHNNFSDISRHKNSEVGPFSKTINVNLYLYFQLTPIITSSMQVTGFIKYKTSKKINIVIWVCYVFILNQLRRFYSWNKNDKGDFCIEIITHSQLSKYLIDSGCLFFGGFFGSVDFGLFFMLLDGGIIGGITTRWGIGREVGWGRAHRVIRGDSIWISWDIMLSLPGDPIWMVHNSNCV